MSLHLLRCGDAKKIHVAATTLANVPFRMDWPTLLRGTWDDTNNISTPSRAPLLSRSASSHSCIFTVRATAPSRTRKYAASASLSYVTRVLPCLKDNTRLRRCIRFLSFLLCIRLQEFWHQMTAGRTWHLRQLASSIPD